ASWNTSGYNNITLTARGVGWINGGGITKFVIRSNREILQYTPVGPEFVGYYNYNCGDASKYPLLTLTYVCSDWLDDYSYRKVLSIEGSTGAQTNYQMRVNVYAAAGTDSGSSVYLNYTCQADFDDVRFTTPSGTSLDFWQETYTSNVSAVFWVECDSIAASPSVTQFLMYYGNPAATSASNGTNTFLTYDDFERGNDGDTVGGAWTEVAAHCHISTEQDIGNVAGYFGTRSAKLVGVATLPAMSIPQTGGDTYALYTRYYRESGAGSGGGQTIRHGNGVKRIVIDIAAADGSITYYDTAWRDTLTDCAAGAWVLLELRNINFTAGTYDIWYDGAAIKTGAAMQTSAGDANIIILVGDDTAGADQFYDNFIVRKFTSTEPSISSWGSQNTLPAPTGVSATDGTYTDKVIISWTEPCGASGYYIYRGGTYVTSVAAGTVSYNDTGATAGTVDVGSPSSTPGIGYVRVTTTGEHVHNASPVAYTLKSYAGTANSTSSSSNTGFRSVGALSYQWQYWDGGAYVNIPGGTTDPYDDYTYAPAPYIYPGTMQASTTNTSSVALSVSGESVITGATNNTLVQYYQIVVSGVGDGIDA
ncbi:DUF2341 domain-containing protein, partial [Candidatus Magnetobacterium casense]